MGIERRPGVILGTPGAILLAGAVCLLAAGFVAVTFSYPWKGESCFGSCLNNAVLLQYTAYPLLYVGWPLVIVGAGSLLYSFLFGRNRPSLSYLAYAGVHRQELRASYPGVEEPATILSR